MKRLIITADDLGMSEAVDAGVLASFDRGLVTSASLIACGPTAASAVEQTAARPDLSLGLHLCFVQGTPVSDPQTIRSLVDGDELLPSVVHLAFRGPTRTDLAVEAQAQLLRFVTLTGQTPAFVNTHQHAQLLPAVLQTIIELCNEHGIPRVRLPAEQHPVRPNRRPRSWLWPAATLVALAGRGALSRAGLRHPDRMVGGPESGRLTRGGLRKLIGSLTDGTTELVVHPSSGTEELAALTDPAIARDLLDAGVRRIPFHAL